MVIRFALICYVVVKYVVLVSQLRLLFCCCSFDLRERLCLRVYVCLTVRSVSVYVYFVCLMSVWVCVCVYVNVFFFWHCFLIMLLVMCVPVDRLRVSLHPCKVGWFQLYFYIRDSRNSLHESGCFVLTIFFYVFFL